MSSSPSASPEPPSPRLSSSSLDKHTPNQPSDAEPMQVFVKDPSNEVTTLKIPPTTSIATLKSLISLQHPHLKNAYPSANTKLMFAGRHLDSPDKPLKDYSILPGATLNLCLPLLGGAEGDELSTDEKAEGVLQESAKVEGKDVVGAVEPMPAPAPAPAPVPETAPTPMVPSTASSSTTSLAKPTPTSTPKPALKRKGPRCGTKDCNAPAKPIIGECGFCKGLFCGKHRLLESHGCEGLEECKREGKKRNKERLEGERTVARGLVGL